MQLHSESSRSILQKKSHFDHMEVKGTAVPGKRLALFLDGTWNTVNDDTNVWRLKSLCATTSDQRCYYSPGVGTSFGDRLIGGLFGYGLDAEVILAYQWVMENYTPGDAVFIFGFSRGAFTARSLSGFISKCGLLKVGAPLSLKQLYSRYRQGSLVRTLRELKNVLDAQLSFEDRWLKEYSLPIPIRFQGVWDTVGALGIPFGNLPTISRSRYSFLETDLRICNDYAFHAMAIDEHREAFAPTLWSRSVQKNAEAYPARPLDQVEQRWFVGAHADVGGGYDDGLLAQVPLNWLMQKARLQGLIFKDTVTIDGDENKTDIHDSFASMGGGVYRALKLGRPFYRTVGAAPSVDSAGTVTTPINETIDATVFDRWRAVGAYRPANLAAWARAHGIDLAAVAGSVRADDLTAVPE
jgi:uncharacterized protein (DUF2235 family)